MLDEIRLLGDLLSGKQWNRETQILYSIKLSSAPFYDGEALNTDFAARDRITRAPKALGLVDLSPVVEITPVGNVFLSSNRPHEIFARQLMKFQLPSPYHVD